MNKVEQEVRKIDEKIRQYPVDRFTGTLWSICSERVCKYLNQYGEKFRVVETETVMSWLQKVVLTG